MRKMATDPANFPSLVDSLKFDCNWVGWERTCNLDQRASQAEGRGFESLLPLQPRSPYVARASGPFSCPGSIDHLLAEQGN